MIKVSVPATSANCCIGFDCMGLALDWRGTFTFTHAEKLEIEGCPSEYQNENNLVVQAFYRVCDFLNKERIPFHLRIDSSIPFARGLGSSATCIVAGMMAANAWYDSCLSKEDLLLLATEMEGHPDNVAPALFGGVCVSSKFQGRVITKKLKTPRWYGLALIPDHELSTKEARKVLPKSIPFSEAKEQVANALLLAEALETGDQTLLNLCSNDHLHEPYRCALIQDFAVYQKKAHDALLPLWISGSGSTMLSLSIQEEPLHELAKSTDSIEYRFVNVDERGAEVVYE